MEDLNDRYYKSEGLSWIVFLFMTFNQYDNFDTVNIPYVGLVEDINIVYVSGVFLLLFIWSQVEYIQSNIIKTSKVILFRNSLLWLLFATTMSFNIDLQGYTEIEIFAWVVGYFVLGVILGETLIISLIMDIVAIFTKQYKFFIFDNVKTLILNIVIMYVTYYLIQRYTSHIVFSNITFPALISGIMLSALKQLVNFSKCKYFSNLQKFRQQMTYINSLHAFGKYQKTELAKFFKEALESNVVIDSKTNKPIQLNKEEQKELIKQIKKGDHRSTQPPKETQKQANKYIRSLSFSDKGQKELPIYFAVCNEDFKKVKQLLKTNNPNNEIASYDWTPLLMAVANGYTDITNLLLESGANPDKANLMGITPLLYACMYDDLITIKKLIEYGADTNCMSEDGRSLLMQAVMSDSKKIVLYLLSQGVTLKKEQSIKIAEQTGNGDIARILRKHKNKR